MRQRLHCKRCTWDWFPRKELSQIILCPNCKSPYWNKDRLGSPTAVLTVKSKIKDVVLEATKPFLGMTVSAQNLMDLRNALIVALSKVITDDS